MRAPAGQTIRGARIASVLAAALLILGGCGDSKSSSDDDSPEAAIRHTVDLFGEAAKNHDGKLLCEQVLPNSDFSQHEIDKCSSGVTDAMNEHPENWSHPATDVTNIKVDGDSATATLTQDGDSNEVSFYRQGDSWRMQVFD